MTVAPALKWGTVAVLVFAVSAFAYAGAAAARDTPSSHSDPAGPFYNVTFNESGLAAGTNWSVALSGGGWWFHSQQREKSDTASIVFSVPNGTYHYRVNAVAGYVVSSGGHGSVVVNGTAPAVVNVSFGHLARYAVTFTETGLPAGTNWTVRVSALWGAEGTRGGGKTSSSSSITFSLTNGTYLYHIRQVPGYSVATGSFGWFNVSGSPPATIAVRFVPLVTYTVTFQESGLPAGTNWTVGVFSFGWGAHRAPTVVTTDASTITFALTNGTYGFFVAHEPGYYVENGSFGFLMVAGAPPPTVNVTFVACGGGTGPSGPIASPLVPELAVA
jgi:hypothetical protein